MSVAPVFARSRTLALVCLVSLLALAPPAPVAPRAAAQGGCTPETTPIAPGQALLGDLVPEDCEHDPQTNAVYDRYTFQATAGAEYTVGMSYYPPAFLDPRVVVRGPSGAVVASDDDSGVDENARVHFTAASSGTYSIEATSSGFGIGPYVVSLSAGPCPPAAAPIEPGQSIGGALWDADCFSPARPGMLHDAYEFEATAGLEYAVVLRTPADDDEEELHFDPYLVLRDPTGAVVAEDDDGGIGWNARIRHTAAMTGTYRVEATSSVEITGTYQIELGSGACPPTPTPIAVGQTLDGRLSEVDCESAARPGSAADLFSFQATAGQQYRISMSEAGDGDDPTTPIDPYLVLRDASGAVLAENDNGGGFSNAAIVVTPGASGALTIEATTATEGTGPYMLTVQATACPVAPTPISPGQTLSGALAATDCFSEVRPGSYSDRYAFIATAGLQYTITASTSAAGFSLVAIVRDPSGATVRTGYGAIIYTPAVSGTFTIELTTDFPNETGAYTLGLLAATCPPSPTSFSESQPASGVLSDSDCSNENGRYDRFSFEAVEGRMYKVIVTGSGMDPRARIVGDLSYTPFCCEFGTRTLTYRPRQAGTVLVEVGSYTGPGSYTIRLESYVCTSASEQIAVGQTVSGSLDATDCYSLHFPQHMPHYAETYTFEATAGEAYVITMESAAFGPYFRLTNPSGQTVIERGEDRPNNTITYTYTAPVSGLHSIEVSSEIERWTGAYTLSLAAGTACESDVAGIAAGQTLAGQLETSDCYNSGPRWATGSHYDRFTISLRAGARYTFGVLTTEYRPGLILRNPAGQIVAEDYDFGWTGTGFPERSISFTYTAPADGVFTLDATSGDPGETGAYTVSVTSNENCNDAVTQVALPSTTEGVLDANDCDGTLQPSSYRDRYTFSGAAGSQVRITLEAFSVDPFLGLFAPPGALVATDDDSGVGDDSRIVVTLPETGTYTIEVTSFPSPYNLTGTYVLRLATGGFECTPEVSPVGVYGTEYGSLAGTECESVSRPGSYADTYTLEAEAGHAYVVSMESSEFDAYLAVFDAAGMLVAENDDGGGGLNARLEFFAPADGTYRIEVTSDTQDAVGFYSVAVWPGQSGAECVPAATELSVGQTVAGELTLEDCYSEIQPDSFHDRYSFQAEAGQSYRIYMAATPVDGETTLDPWLVLYFGDDGALVQGDDTDDGTNNAEIVFTSPETAQYTFEATTYEPEQTGHYTVVVEQVVLPDDEGDLRGGATCETRTLKVEPGQKLQNSLLATDCAPAERPSSHHNRYTLSAAAGRTYTVTMSSTEIDSRLLVLDPSGTIVAEDDNGAGKLNARVEITAPAAGTYTLLALSTGVLQTGRYELAVEGRSADTVGIHVPATGAWFLRNTNAPGPADVVFSYGPAGAGWTPLAGDWDGDGRRTAGLYDPSTGVFFLRDANTPGGANVVFGFGAGGAGLVPVVGDWNGDGVETVGVYNPSTGVFFLRNANAPGGADVVFGFGAGGVGFVPISGDWNGDGDDTVGLYNPATGAFFLRNQNAPGGADLVFTFGGANAGLRVIAGDWDADGRETVGLYSPATGVFFLRDEHAGGGADATFGYGPAGAVPLAGDWNSR